MPTTKEPKAWYIKVGGIAGSVMAVGGLVWAIVEAIMWAGMFAANVRSLTSDVSAMKTSISDLNSSVRQKMEASKERDEQRFREMEATEEGLALAVERVRTEVRIRHSLPSSPSARRSALADAESRTNAAVTRAMVQVDPQVP